MLLIRSKQFEKLRREGETKFIRRMMTYLRQRFDSQVGDMSQKELETLVRKGIQDARAFNIRKARNLRSYLCRVVLCGRDFPNQPSTAWMRPILEDFRLSEFEKMEKLIEREIFGVTNQVNGDAGQNK